MKQQHIQESALMFPPTKAYSTLFQPLNYNTRNENEEKKAVKKREK